jgi:hypothetical protein
LKPGSVIIFAILALDISSQGQDFKFDPEGDPANWNVEIAPFFVMPYLNGEIHYDVLSTDFSMDPSGFIKSLNGTLMMDMTVSKGKFFAFARYNFNYNEIETITWTIDNGNQTISARPELERHILQVSGGMRFRLGEKFILDPYAGFRYTIYHLFGEIEGIAEITEIETHEDFWDPVLGLHAHYYTHPRVPVGLRADFGGFGAGSKFSWSACFNSGYTVSPAFDIIAGIAVLSNDYENEAGAGNTYGITSTTYGFDLGFRFYIPGRGKDPSVFKKKYN